MITNSLIEYLTLNPETSNTHSIHVHKANYAWPICIRAMQAVINQNLGTTKARLEVMQLSSFDSCRSVATQLARNGQGVDFVGPLLQDHEFQQAITAAPAKDRICLVCGLLCSLQPGWKTSAIGKAPPLPPQHTPLLAPQQLALAAEPIKAAILYDREQREHEGHIVQLAKQGLVTI